MGYLTGWSHKDSIELPAITSENSNIHVIAKITYHSAMQTDFDDIRFTDTDGETELGHFLLKKTDSTEAYYMMKIPTYPAAGKSIWIYWGNAGVSSASSISDTFPDFQDDFTGDLSKWTESGDYTVEIVSEMMKAHHTTSGDHTIQNTSGQWAAGYGMICRIKVLGEQTYAPRLSAGWCIAPNWKQYYYRTSTTTHVFRAVNGGTEETEVTDIQDGSFHILDITREVGGDTKCIIDLEQEAEHSKSFSNCNIGFYLTHTHPGVATELWCDWIAVYKMPTDGDEIGTLEPSGSPTFFGGEFVEPVIASIKETLENDLSTWVDAVNAEHDDFQIANITRILEGRHYVVEPEAIVIWPDDSPGSDYTQETLSARHRIRIMAVVAEASDQEILNKRLWRMLRAITDCIKQSDNLDGRVDVTAFLGHTYDGPWPEMDEGGYLMVGGVIFDFEKEEDVT